MGITDDILGSEDHLVASCKGVRGLIRSQVFDLVIIGPGPVHVDVDMHSLTTVHFTAALRMN